jgi:hypothetical protein
MKFLLIFALAASAWALNPRLSTPVLIANNAQRVDACHVPNCTTNQEIVYDAVSSTACSTGGFAYHIYSAHTDGTSVVDLTATKAAFSGLALNTGSPVLSYDGNWLMFLAQAATSNSACSGNFVNPGSGGDQDIYIAPFPGLGSSTKMTTIIPNIGTGMLHPHWTTDQSLVYAMNIQGLGHTNAAVYGRVSYWPFTTPGSVPTFGTRTNWTDGINMYNWYEPGYALTPCVAAFSSGITWPTTYIFTLNLCAGSGWTQIQGTPSYNEFWCPDSTGSIALSTSTQFSPGNPPSGAPFAAAPKAGEIVISSATSNGGWLPLTGYNQVGASDYIPGSNTTVSSPVWYNGQTTAFWTRISGGTYSIWSANFKAVSEYRTGQTQTSGQVTEQ